MRLGMVELVKIKKIEDQIRLYINMHLHRGVYFTLSDQKVYLYEEYEEQFKVNLFNSFKEILSFKKNKGIDICIENTGVFSKSYIQHALLDVLKEENVFLTWDVGHDAASGFLDTPFLKNHESKIKHIHLHE